MGDECRFHFGGRDAVTADVHDVVDTAEQPQVTLVVEFAAVTGEVSAFEATPVGLDITLRITPDATQHPRPWPRQREITTAALDLAAGVVDDFGADPRERKRRRPRLQRRGAGQRTDHDPAGLGLPPGVDNGA